MTPKQWAHKLIAALDEARRSGRVVHEHELTEAAFEEAIAAEREACAKIADEVALRWYDLDEMNGGPAADEVAAAIRARGQTT